jgi:CRP/FNR family transcriptional regulator, nitrogen oxide reductase regulator
MTTTRTPRRRTPLSTRSADPGRCNDYVRLQALRHIPLFADLDEGALRAIDARCTVRNRDTGEPVHLAGQPAERIFVPVHGAVKLFRTTPDGEEVLLDIVGPGALLGGLPALGDDRYAATAHALTPVCLLSLDAAGFDWVLRTHPQVARTALRLVGRRLHAAHRAIEQRSTATAEQRVTAVLLGLGDQHGVHRDGALLIDVPLTREDLGSLTGCTPETVSRILADLHRRGVLDTGRRWVAIRDRTTLRTLAPHPQREGALP